jgi:multidrug efflux system membrane fusion protein
MAKDMPVSVRAIGHVEAQAMVTVRARVGGELLKTHIEEGQTVKKNALLFEIDPRPYQIALQQIKAGLERDKILAKKAADDVKRYQGLAQKDYVTQDQYQQLLTNAEVLKANILASEAALANANLQLDYTKIRAPISGRTGLILIDTGNIVKANDDKGLVVIDQIAPIDVAFAVPETYLASIKKEMLKGKLRVSVALKGLDQPIRGTLDFIDNAVDGSTGTINLKARFANGDEMLWPGQFVEVTLELRTLPQVTVIPSQAVMIGQQGNYAFVVKPDKSVEIRVLTTGLSLAGETVIESGLQVGEEVVTDGQLRLIPGAKVEVAQKR